MKKTVNFLAILLLLQLVLLFGLKMLKADSGDFGDNDRLLAFSPDQVDQLLIDGGEKERLSLKKNGDKWTLSDYDDAAVDMEKVTSLLGTLTAIKRTWPVAETDQAMTRFKVADESFERRLIFKSGNQTLTTLLLGSSPGFKKVHARLQGEKKVFDIPFSTYQASLKTADWIDKEILQLEEDQVVAIEFPGFTLQQNNDDLSLADLSGDETLDQEKAKRLLEKVASLNIMDLDPGAPESEAVSDGLNITVKLADGLSRQYRFYRLDEKYFLKVSGRKQTYKISKALFEGMQNVTRKGLVSLVGGGEKEI